MSTSTSTRLVGCFLEFMGAPYDTNGLRIGGLFGTTGGTGRAKCSCGVLSKELPSLKARQVWHRDHKDENR